MSQPRIIREGIPDLVPMLHRSPGTHVSQLIHSLCLLLGHYADTHQQSDSDPADDSHTHATRLQLGCALETAIANRYSQSDPNRYVQPGELTLDSLHGTPDLLDTLDWACEEIKLTWMSSRHGDDPDSQKFWKYWVQLKAYCQMIETRVGRLHVCFINGDYKQSGPIYRVWEVVFSIQDLAENWQMLKSHELEMINRHGKHYWSGI